MYPGFIAMILFAYQSWGDRLGTPGYSIPGTYLLGRETVKKWVICNLKILLSLLES